MDNSPIKKIITEHEKYNREFIQKAIEEQERREKEIRLEQQEQELKKLREQIEKERKGL